LAESRGDGFPRLGNQINGGATAAVTPFCKIPGRRGAGRPISPNARLVRAAPRAAALLCDIDRRRPPRSEHRRPWNAGV